MGYTHSFGRRNAKSRNISEAKRKQIVPVVQKIISRYDAILTGDVSGETRQPVILAPETDEICFNGIGKHAHEGFHFSFKGELPKYDFCKTERKPYDDPVMEILIVLKHFIPGLSVRSNGFGTKECPYSDPEIAWVNAARRVHDLYGITTKLFFWDGNPEPDAKAKKTGKKSPAQ